MLCVPNLVYLFDLRMSIVKYFSIASIKSEFGNKGEVEFYWNIWNISNMYETCKIKANVPLVSLFKTFASNGSFIYNHHQTIKQENRKSNLWSIEINL